MGTAPARPGPASPAAGPTDPYGVLLMAYGTPSGPEGILNYYTHIRRGRAPSAAQVAELQARYEAIGGSSPLLEIARAQAAGLQELLSGAESAPVPVELGMKHATPFVERGVESLVLAGLRRAVAIVLAPHYSRLSTGEYFQRARAAAGGRIELDFIEHWHLAPAYVELLAERLRDALAQLPQRSRTGVQIVFTAHSLPERILKFADPYPTQLRQTAQAVARRMRLGHWSMAWQSAGRTEEPWLGPDILEEIDRLAQAGATAVVVCPCGFVSDHLEILYDLDIQARERARERGIAFVRTALPNSDPAFIRTLADVVRSRALSAPSR